ncbi:lysoplasmalogenase-like protein TMEM86A [Gouania willdenowi]|uniref:lysoplasmalogenase n=1 Tax=Gouania willdenowi TaxID=441366 RepID=A0A8C5GW49_GOUWI|nr:lysoplasmalogenase-like protein TMEM86A [Gouania willdenowi]
MTDKGRSRRSLVGWCSAVVGWSDPLESLCSSTPKCHNKPITQSISCALFLSLLPFFASTGLYFYLWTPESKPSIIFAAVKSAPILLLAAVVLSWNGCQNVLGVVGGLLFSAVGDWCLIWSEYFLHGMGAFSASHLLYSLAFLSSRYATHSSSSWTRILSLILLLIGGAFYFYLYPFLQKAPNFKIETPAVGAYIFLTVFMGALAIRTRRFATLMGSLVFMVSDMSLAVQVFNAAKIAHVHYFVMGTYYLAQLLIAVGDIRASENKEDFGKWKRP